MLKTVLFGIGNPLRGDDGVGWHVLTQLEAELADSNTAVFPITFVTTHQLFPEHADLISQAGQVIFVDAALSTPPGQINSRVVVPLPTERSAFSHHLTPAHLLSLAAEIYGRYPPALLLTLNGATFELRETLSPEVKTAVGHCLKLLRTLITNHGAPPAKGDSSDSPPPNTV